MIKFGITIESQDGEQITLGGVKDSTITDVKVQFDTLDDNVMSKSNAMVARIEIRGNLEDSNNEQLQKVFNWAKDFRKTSTYRTVKIVIYDSEEGGELRNYSISPVFVTDYTEEYQSTDGEERGGLFFLKMNQVQNNFDNAKTY